MRKIICLICAQAVVMAEFLVRKSVRTIAETTYQSLPMMISTVGAGVAIGICLALYATSDSKVRNELIICVILFLIGLFFAVMVFRISGELTMSEGAYLGFLIIIMIRKRGGR